MDIKDILDNLGLDLTNPDVRRGAIEAIDAILGSRQPPIDLGDLDGSGLMNSSEAEEVEIDPDLLLPSRKHQAQGSLDDIEIDDEEQLLDKVKHNESDNDFDSNTAGRDQDSDKKSSATGESTDDEYSDTEGSDVGISDPTDIDDNTEASSEEKFAEPSNSTSSLNNPENNSEDDSSTEDSYFENEEDADDKKASSDADLSGDSGDNDESAGGGRGGDDDDSVNYDDTELSDEDSVNFDEDDILDDDLRDTFEDEIIKTKQHARKIKRERTLVAAKKALASAQDKKASPALIRNLEKTIAALEALKEAAQKNLKDISDGEFNILINNVLDAIDALGDSGLTYKSDEERELQAKEIKADLASAKTQQELSAEDIAQIRAENQVIQAREKEASKYKSRNRNSFKGFQEFLNSLYRAIALQVATEETRDDSWSAINRRYSGTSVLQPGKRVDELPNKKIPVIDFYFDQSGSWDESDIEVGKQAVSKLVEMEEAGDIKINIFYFANHVHTEASEARAEGGTRAWNDIVKNVISTQATNVIIMTDSDMEDWWDGDKALTYTVPGYVWYLWRGGDNAQRLPRDLKGRGGTQQFSF